MAVHIRHKSALTVLALALTLYAGAKFCCPGGRGVPSSPEESGEGTRPPSSLSAGDDAPAASPLAISAFGFTPSNVTLDVAWIT